MFWALRLAGRLVFGDRAVAVGNRVRAQLAERIGSVHRAARVRGAGLMIGIELANATEAQRVIAGALQRGYLVISGGVHGDTLTLTPPLTIDEQLLLGFGDAVCEILQE